MAAIGIGIAKKVGEGDGGEGIVVGVLLGVEFHHFDALSPYGLRGFRHGPGTTCSVQGDQKGLI